eukprot:gene27406-33771_t
MDHLRCDEVDISAYYVDLELRAHLIPSSQLYSNTPSDFDFKLRLGGSDARTFGSMQELVEQLQASTDIVFPVMHGQFGEDGEFQSLLEAAGVPFVGTGAKASCQAFDKCTAASTLESLGYFTLPSILFETIPGGVEHHLPAMQKWFEEQDIDTENGRVVVKPARAGSSVGVSVAIGLAECQSKVQQLFAEGIDTKVLVERYAEGGMEFTLIVLQGSEGPVALIPSEVELRVEGTNDGEPSERAIFNYRRKYLPTSQ